MHETLKILHNRLIVSELLKSYGRKGNHNSTGKIDVHRWISELVKHIGNVLQSARGKAAQSVNTILIDTYWQIGKYIVEYEQQGKARAEYGDKLIERLSKDLTLHYGKGFGKSNLLYIRKFYSVFSKGGTVSHQLSWSHYYEILKLDNPLEMQFYMHQCETSVP